MEEVENVGVVASSPNTRLGYDLCKEVPGPKHAVLVRPCDLAVARETVDEDDARYPRGINVSHDSLSDRDKRQDMLDNCVIAGSPRTQ